MLSIGIDYIEVVATILDILYTTLKNNSINVQQVQAAHAVVILEASQAAIHAAELPAMGDPMGAENSR